MGTAVVSGPNAQKAVVSGPKAQKWLQAAQDLFDGLQSTWSHHMVSRQPLKKFHGLQNAKKVRMGRNVPKRWSPLDLSGAVANTPNKNSGLKFFLRLAGQTDDLYPREPRS
jgi:hypothetical protein